MSARGGEFLPVSTQELRQILADAFLGAGYDAPRIEEGTRSAFATRSVRGRGHYETSSRTKAEVRWTAVRGGVNLTCKVWDDSAAGGALRPDLGDQLAAAFAGAARSWAAGRPIRELERAPHDKVVAPGEKFSGEYTGTLLDYSGCATAGELDHLAGGTLPLGRYAFDHGRPGGAGKPLSLTRFRNGGPMEYNGVLVCAPQNSGKTTLLERWAEAATKADPGYAVFVVDVKGNLRQKLRDRNLRGDVYFFTTDPDDPASDRINFLDGPAGLDRRDMDRIRQLATALLPSRGFVEGGGIDEYHYRNRVIWLTAFIQLLKLEQHYYPHHFVDQRGKPRNVDLADLYDLIASEERVYENLGGLIEAERQIREQGGWLPPCGVEHWTNELAIMLDPRRIEEGQRPEKDTFRTYTIGLLSALEPFSGHGTMHERIRGFGPGRLFDIESVLGGERRPVTVVLSARQQDLEKADVVLAMAIKRLQWLLFDRMQQPDAGRRPILLLLDETRRIRDFNVADYVAFAREAKAACVVVYQALDQIGPAATVTSLLENVGTQIYLGSLVGNTARYFVDILPKRTRDVVTRQVVHGADTLTQTEVLGREQVDYFGTAELYHLPAGDWPALVYVNDQPRTKPFLVDMAERSPRSSAAAARHAPRRARPAPAGSRHAPRQQ